MFKKKALTSAIALAGLLGLGAFGTAQAAALATSTLQVNNLLFTNPLTGEALDTSDFATLSYTSSADTSASLIGFPTATDTGTSNNATPIDLPQTCVGTCFPVAENSFAVVSSNGGAPTATYASSDTNEIGAPITGLPAPLGANIGQAAYVGLLDQAGQQGSSNSNNELSANWTFSLPQGVPAAQIGISFNATAYAEAFVSAVEYFPANASASFSSVLEILDTVTGQVILRWSPDGVLGGGGSTELGLTELADPFSLNQSRSSNAPGTNGLCLFAGAACGTADSGQFAALTDPLLGGRLYQLSWRLNTNADAQNVPEPATLSLIGLGLLGMGAVGRRRRRSS